MRYVEATGCCFNIDEKMKFSFALSELAFDLKLDKVWLVGKVQGRLDFLASPPPHRECHALRKGALNEK